MISFANLNCSGASSRRRKQARNRLHAGLASDPGSNLTAAHVPDVSALSDDVLQEQLMVAQHEAMEAKAEYELRNRISHNVLVMDPILKAVHGGENTGYAEK